MHADVLTSLNQVTEPSPHVTAQSWTTVGRASSTRSRRGSTASARTPCFRGHPGPGAERDAGGIRGDTACKPVRVGVSGEPAGQQPELGAPRPGFLLSGLLGHQHGRSRGQCKPAQEFLSPRYSELATPGDLASRAGRVLAPPARSWRPPASVCVPSRLRPSVQSPLETVSDKLPEPRCSQPGAQSAWLPQLQNGQVQQGAPERDSRSPRRVAAVRQNCTAPGRGLLLQLPGGERDASPPQLAEPLGSQPPDTGVAGGTRLGRRLPSVLGALHLPVCKAGQSIRNEQSRRRPPRPGLQLEGVLPPSATDSEKL
jgi:hypothetical protein